MCEFLIVVFLMQPDVVLYHTMDDFQLTNPNARRSISKRRIGCERTKHALVSIPQGATS